MLTSHSRADIELIDGLSHGDVELFREHTRLAPRSHIKCEFDASDASRVGLTVKSEPSAPLAARTPSRKMIARLLSCSQIRTRNLAVPRLSFLKTLGVRVAFLRLLRHIFLVIPSAEPDKYDLAAVQESDTRWMDHGISSTVRIMHHELTSDSCSHIERLEYITTYTCDHWDRTPATTNTEEASNCHRSRRLKGVVNEVQASMTTEMFYRMSRNLRKSCESQELQLKAKKSDQKAFQKQSSVTEKVLQAKLNAVTGGTTSSRSKQTKSTSYKSVIVSTSSSGRVKTVMVPIQYDASNLTPFNFGFDTTQFDFSMFNNPPTPEPVQNPLDLNFSIFTTDLAANGSSAVEYDLNWSALTPPNELPMLPAPPASSPPFAPEVPELLLEPTDISVKSKGKMDGLDEGNILHMQRNRIRCMHSSDNEISASSGQLNEGEPPFDYEGVDLLASVILNGCSSWFSKLEPRAAELLPRSSSCATTLFEDIIPTSYKAVKLNVTADRVNSTISDQDDGQSQVFNHEDHSETRSLSSTMTSLEASQNISSVSNDESCNSDAQLYDIQDVGDSESGWDLSQGSNSYRDPGQAISGMHNIVLVEEFAHSTLYPSLKTQREGAEQLKLILVQRHRDLGDNHPETIVAMENLASAHYKLGEYRLARDLHVVALEKRRIVSGEDHPDTLRIVGVLGSTYHELGQFEEAESLKLEVLEKRKKVLGPDYPGTLWAMGNFAMTHRRLGRLAEAENPLIQVLEKQRQVLGEDHSDTLHTMGNLAAIYEQLGQLTDVESLVVQVLEKREKLWAKTIYPLS
ncbi:hypothetical protein B0H10DRAFT_1944622 [Mycena sp. CBHHK59/15]|nr:hypothetical protein B0H10DRAFT_1944622 [Mycena sp. CBHHK59/15]